MAKRTSTLFQRLCIKSSKVSFQFVRPLYQPSVFSPYQNRLLCTQRGPPSAGSIGEWLGAKKVILICVLGTAITAIGSLFGGIAKDLVVTYYQPQLIAKQNQRQHLKINDERWQITKEPPMRFPRNECRSIWLEMIEEVFNQRKDKGYIVWMFGPKAVGKTTMLKHITYELQSKKTRNKIIYVDLSSSHSHEVEKVILSLRETLSDTVKRGFTPCVIFNSIGPLCKEKIEGENDLGEEMTLDEFRKVIVPIGADARIAMFFRFVKAMADQYGGKFIFLTSKPFHLAIHDRRLAWYIKDRSVQIDTAGSNSEFGLQLSKKEAVDIVKCECNDEALLKDIESMTDSEFKASSYSKIGHLLMKTGPARVRRQQSSEGN